MAIVLEPHIYVYRHLTEKFTPTDIKDFQILMKFTAFFRF